MTFWQAYLACSWPLASHQASEQLLHVVRGRSPTLFCPPNSYISRSLPLQMAANHPTSSSAGPAQSLDKPSTSSHPPSTKPDPTTSSHAAQGGLATAAAPAASQLASLQVSLKQALRQYPDFPEKGVLFEDIMPIFAQPALHNDLITALELLIATRISPTTRPDIIVGLDARGFLFGPTLALRLDAGFVPVRKKGKLPGKVETAAYQKEYGADYFQLQSDSIKPGQKVLVLDDIIATGKSSTLTR